jgi:hypothetical protein
MSTPPPIAPVSTPTPEPRRPWWRRRVAVAGVVLISAAVAHANTGSNDACLVNGFGNKLCGADAIAYCQLLDIPTTPLSNAEWNHFTTCTDVGWTPNTEE